MKDLPDLIKRFLRRILERNGTTPTKRKALFLRLAVLMMLGIALLIGNRLFASPPAGSSSGKVVQTFSSTDAKKLSQINTDSGKAPSASLAAYESYVNQNLKNILEQIEGVSNVSVMVTFSSTEKSIYQNDVKTQDNQTVESDQKGGTRRINQRNQETQVVMIDKNGTKEPVMIGKEQPAVRGCIVVAAGASQPAIRAEIMDAVSTVLAIPDYQVKVLQKSE
ncbi:stage III sporulation protein AG [Sporolactobacillus vineae]|uniref:stage III sporulation protein AG n=1 Tax=Sporolactobacillus vineae TaxID=444463 RepID=UPI000289A72B|nr:stage III sporulation protein AG [Sporolactobacillus vineae]